MTKAGFLNNYEQCIKSGKLQDDPAQRAVGQHLQALCDAISTKPDLIHKLIQSRHSPLRGVYLWGDVGRGKSMLMDLFLKAVTIKAKQRVHFYSLMLGIHKNVHAARQKDIDDPVMHVATELAKKTRLLCIDEFQVTDVADAMILSKLFTTLLDKNVILFITSNRPPEELYLGGLQREKFLDFVELIRARMEILELVSPIDYRTQKIRNLQSAYLSPLSKENDTLLKKIFSELSNNIQPEKVVLEVQGRKLQMVEAAGKVAKFSFSDLCEKPLGAADYLAICQRFDTVFVSNIPLLSPEKRNEARRFVTLIDTLYDNHTKLICTAAVAPEKLYPAGDGVFEFHRTVSRLIEMQSEQYLAA